MTTTNAHTNLQPLLIDRRTAARLLGLSVRGIDYAVASGLIRPRRLGRRVLFTQAELQRFAARDHRRITPEADGNVR